MMALIRSWPIDGVDHKDLNWRAPRFQFQPELLLQCGHQRWQILTGGRWWTADDCDWLGRERQLDLERAGDPRPV